MSARTKIQGNRAITCDEPGCAATFMAHVWWHGANEARATASHFGWTRTSRKYHVDYPAPEGDMNIGHSLDLCPEHSKVAS